LSERRPLEKVYEDEEVIAYRLLEPSLTRADIARALGRSAVDPFNVLNEVSIKYYNEALAPHGKMLRLARRYGLPLVVLWKKLPSPLELRSGIG